MTFVAAKRFGERVLIASDTMISDLTGMPHDVIPGRLKVITICPTITVAYAGLPDQGIDAIKAARLRWIETGKVSELETVLVGETQEYFGKLEFLLVVHQDGVSLKRIWDGRVSASLDQACIGQRDLLSALLALVGEVPHGMVPHEFEEESQFSSAFDRLFSGIYISESAGGFGIKATCSPYGHYMSGFVGSMAWDTVFSGQNDTEQKLADRRSGMTQWAYNISGPKLRGVAVVGAVILDAGVGFIYDPIHQNGPILERFMPPKSQDEARSALNVFQKRVNHIAERFGGGIEVQFPPPSSNPPSEHELSLIMRHASSTLFPTEITMLEDAVWIRCGTDVASQGVRVGFNMLGENPVSTLTTTIDRMNEAIQKRVRR